MTIRIGTLRSEFCVTLRARSILGLIISQPIDTRLFCTAIRITHNVRIHESPFQPASHCLVMLPTYGWVEGKVPFPLQRPRPSTSLLTTLWRNPFGYVVYFLILECRKIRRPFFTATMMLLLCCLISGDADPKRTKHTDVAFHFVRDNAAKRVITVKRIPTQHQLADLLTKPLSAERFINLPQLISMYWFDCEWEC